MKAGAKHGRVFVYGASGHGKVVADILLAGETPVGGFIDDDPQKAGKFFGLNVLGDAKWLIDLASKEPVSVALGIGDNVSRGAVAERCTQAGIDLLTAVHPSATVSTSAKVSSGTVIMAQAVINADAIIGRSAIINTASIVEHDCVVGNFAHLSPKVAIGGGVSIGDYSWLGIGSSVVPATRIGTGSIIGAGATVIRDVDDWVVVVGTPARYLKDLPRRV